MANSLAGFGFIAPIRGIAVQLELSIKTVSTHKARILDKMNLPGLSELVRYAICHDLLPRCPDDDKDGNSSGTENDRP
jgi:hypothetical protein